jgi:hypothetical protein
MPRPKKPAPTIGLVDYSAGDERKQLIARYVPDAVERRDPQTGEKIAPKLHAFFGDESKPDSYYIGQGYTVVVSNGEKIQHNGSALFTIPHERHAAKMNLHAEMGVQARESARVGASVNSPVPLNEEERDGD